LCHYTSITKKPSQFEQEIAIFLFFLHFSDLRLKERAKEWCFGKAFALSGRVFKIYIDFPSKKSNRT